MEAPLPYENCFSAGAEGCGCSKWCQNPSKAANSIYPPHWQSPPHTFYTLDCKFYVFQIPWWATLTKWTWGEKNHSSLHNVAISDWFKTYSQKAKVSPIITDIICYIYHFFEYWKDSIIKKMKTLAKTDTPLINKHIFCHRWCNIDLFQVHNMCLCRTRKRSFDQFFFFFCVFLWKQMWMWFRNTTKQIKWR